MITTRRVLKNQALLLLLLLLLIFFFVSSFFTFFLEEEAGIIITKKKFVDGVYYIYIYIPILSIVFVKDDFLFLNYIKVLLLFINIKHTYLIY